MTDALWSFSACFSVSLYLSRKRSSFLQERPLQHFFTPFLLFSVSDKQENDETETDLHSCFFVLTDFFPAHMTVSFCVHTLLVSWSFSARVSVSLFRKINFLFSFSFPPQNEEEEKRKKRVKSEAGGRRWDRYWGLIDLSLLCILDCSSFFSSCSNWIIDQR